MNSPSSTVAPISEMQLIKAFDHGKLPSVDVQTFIQSTNELIIAYNSPNASSDERSKYLNQIYQQTRRFDHAYPPEDIADSDGYKSAHDQLISEIQKQNQYLEQNNMLLGDAEPTALSRLIANMSPEKADKLSAILIKGAHSSLEDELSELYPIDDASDEAIAFDDFLNTYDIEYLGGGNSKNWKFTHKITQESQVLKVDYRLNMPREIADHLQKAMPSHFTPIHAERSVICPDPKTDTLKASRTLIVTDLCTGGSVFSFRAKQGTYTKLYQETPKIFGQMARCFEGISQQGCFFPDAKITNWLVDGNGKVLLADTKSFVYTDDAGQYNHNLAANENYGFLSTTSFWPPEYAKGRQGFDADKAHSYMLGLNLYAFITGNIAYNPDTERNEPDFSHQAFNKYPGGKYKDLLEKLLDPDPKQRLSCEKAYQELWKLNHHSLAIDIEDLIKYADKGTFTPDGGINAFLENLSSRIDNGEDVSDEVSKLSEAYFEIDFGFKSIEHFIEILKKQGLNHQDPEVQKVIDKYKDKLNDCKDKFMTITEDDFEQLSDEFRADRDKCLSLLKEKAKAIEAIDKLSELQFGSEDREMQAYIDNLKQQVNEVDNISALRPIVTEAKQTEKAMKDNGIQYIKGQITKLHNENSFASGKESKANHINDAMLKVPIEQRKSFTACRENPKANPEVFNVLKAMAKTRSISPFAQRHLLNRDGTLNESQATGTYKRFIQKYPSKKAPCMQKHSDNKKLMESLRNESQTAEHDDNRPTGPTS